MQLSAVDKAGKNTRPARRVPTHDAVAECVVLTRSGRGRFSEADQRKGIFLNVHLFEYS